MWSPNKVTAGIDLIGRVVIAHNTDTECCF